MTEITRCNRIGFHYNGFLKVLDNSNPAYNAKLPIKIFKKSYFCSNCGTWGKTTSVGRKHIGLMVRIPRLFCKACGSIRQANLDFADPKKHYTRSLERFVIDLCRIMTIADAAQFTGLSWDTVKEIDKSYLRDKYQSVSLAAVRYIAIDEVYLGRKRKFITIVMDLETGQVIHVGKGKGKDALNGLWKRLKRCKANIKAVATDMASGYMSVVMEKLPDADLVLDHFHLVKWFNDKLSLLRRQLYHEADVLGKDVLKGSRYLLLKASENLNTHIDKTKDERARLQAALELNQPLATAYYMKERNIPANHTPAKNYAAMSSSAIFAFFSGGFQLLGSNSSIRL